MTTLFTHPAMPIALFIGLGTRIISPRLLLLGVIGTLLPDLDAISFKLGIPYSSDFGHRGFMHSIVFAGLFAFLSVFFTKQLRSKPIRIFCFVFLCTVSHALLDALTNGGLGVALFWPFESTRFFFPHTPIEVSPIGLGFFGTRGWAVIKSELYWVWCPSLALSLTLLSIRLLISVNRIKYTSNDI